jgi:transcription antitermination factor NusG
MLNWYVIYVNVRHEKRVVQKLLDKGLHAYSPVVKRLRQWSDRKKWVEFPMISGYVFVKIDIIDKEKILSNPAILGFVKFDGKEAVIPEKEIDILKSIELTGFDVSQEVGFFNLNDEVEISQGHLKGLIGTVVRIQNEEYLQIELDSLRQSIKVKVPRHILKIKKASPLSKIK